MGEAAHARQEEKMIVNRKAAKSTVDSLLMMANAGRFAPSDVDLVGTIAHHLTQAFDKENVFGNMFEALQHLRLLCPVPQPASQPSMSTDTALTAGKLSDGEDATKDSTGDDKGSSVYYDRHEDERSNSSEDLLAAVSALPYDEHFESDTIPLLSLPSPPRNI
ncbi:hypothetical protein PHLGIDRAFT_383589 [Phlebiopsis gigantea 11061_1 CR5-6]|uniref:Uncharacterized protein n=1 Tax=Phlebiopsis gigantea (strain 11061_1 CR5-6) TaxID=745531 RepID=A0A0C3NT05_PHLG1|nr:hypothetical protein PHLGIDRAFT_383589 [Phlebiopsis gigantea 11061_1 CR5-6]